MKSNFKTKTGATVLIDIDEDSYIASVTDMDGKDVGSIEFLLIEEPAAPDGYYLKIAYAFLEGQEGKFLHQGIGTRCVELMKEMTGLPISVSDNDGNVRDDGSHLTGDAPAWVEGLRRRGLVH